MIRNSIWKLSANFVKQYRILLWTTDIIVGFPGETEEDFMETLDVVKQVEYDSAFTFIYSKRTGTPAAAMENQVDPAEVKAHFDMLLKEVQAISTRKAMELEGKTVEVLAEEQNEQDASLITGRLSNNAVVHFPGDTSMIGNLYMVKTCRMQGILLYWRSCSRCIENLAEMT